MSARQRLEAYLDSLRHRLRTHIYVQAGALAALGVLVVTCLAVWLLNREEFSASIAITARVALLALLIAIGVVAVWLPLRRLSRDDGSRIFEQRLPEERGRIQTYLDSKRREAEGHGSPLIELLAADAANIAEKTPPSTIVSSRRLGIGWGIAAISAIALAALLAFGPSYWGFGSRHLLLGAELPREAIKVKRILVMPGDAKVRRNSDLTIRAEVEGFTPEHAQVFVRFEGQEKWEGAPMRTDRDGQFDFKLYAVRGPLAYFIDADGFRSQEHTIGVVDLPRIEKVRLTYSYPEWTGLDPLTDEESRDIEAVAGTEVKVEVFADAPLESPALIVSGTTQELEAQGRSSIGSIDVETPGKYQIGARVADEFVALSDEYSIEIVNDEKPVIEIRKPSRDLRATSIEEVPVHIEAQDDFKLRDVTLHYSVNGGDWQKMPVGGGARRSENESLLRMEELGEVSEGSPQRLVPGDLVSYYAVARDRKQSVQTDLFMVQVQPFERTFKQAQGAGGGGGGMGEEQGAISERQREILLATWNLQRNDERNARTRQQLEDSAKMLSELQTTLSQQARTLAQRTRARMSVEDDERVKTFVESLERAAGLMDPAAGHLSAFRLNDAVPPEQQALQQLLRAESAYREVQISMQQDSGGGEGSQSRNFSEMFELEMDIEKSQYESESQLSQQNSQQELSEALRKLKELAERQERLAQEQNRLAQQTPEQRWQQEQLRREAEDLRRRLDELNRQQRQASSQQQGNASQKGGSSSSGQSGGQSGKSGGNSQERSELEKALQSVNQALQDMQAANQQSGEGSASSAQAAKEAGRKLRQAARQIDKPDTSRLDETLNQFANRSEKLLEEQRRVESDLYEALGDKGETRSRGNISQNKVRDLVESKQQMANDLSTLQSDMRNAVHEHRTKSPESSQKLSEIVRDIEGSDVMYRLNRSAAEIYYGRARDAAPREGLITEAFENMEHNLREAASGATRERTGKRDAATTDDLLAQVAELRRAVESARRDTEDQRGASGERGEGQQGESKQPGQNTQAGNAESKSSSAGESGSQGEAQYSRNAQSTRRGGEGARDGLSAWDPIIPNRALTPPQAGRGSLAEQTADIGQRIREITNRMTGGQLTQAELEALRRNAFQLRRLSGDPMAEQGDAMIRLIDQIELTALNAAMRAKGATPAHATLPSPDSPKYREAVAEYYRRLGNR